MLITAEIENKTYLLNGDSIDCTGSVLIQEGYDDFKLELGPLINGSLQFQQILRHSPAPGPVFILFTMYFAQSFLFDHFNFGCSFGAAVCAENLSPSFGSVAS